MLMWFEKKKHCCLCNIAQNEVTLKIKFKHISNIKLTAADEGTVAKSLVCYEGTTHYNVLTVCERNQVKHIRIREECHMIL